MEERVSKQIIVDYSHSLTRIGVVMDGKLTHMYLDTPVYENTQDRIIVGQIDKVVKNLQGAFVNFGEEKNGLLHFKQVPACYQNKLQQGARIPVQIKKENTGDKGHKLTGLLNIQGYYLVCMVFEPEICISKKIKDVSLREKLKETLFGISHGKYGFMVRTKAQDVSLEVLQKEAKFLMEEADRLIQTKDYVSRGTVLLREDPLYLQVITEHMHRGESIEIICNQESIVEELKRRMSFLGEDHQVSYRCYPYNENLFKLLSYQKAFDHTLKHKIWLKNGGNIVVDYTEAMTVIDVNSAKAVLTKNKRKAVMELNKLAVEEGLYQILQRNLAGMVLMDLVDLNDPEDKIEIFEFAKALCSQYDKERLKVYPVTEIGLLQLTRTKKYASVKDILNNQLIYKIYQLEEQLKHISLHAEQEKVFIYCSVEIYRMIQMNDWENAFSDAYKMSIFWQVDKGSKEDCYEIKYHGR